MHSVLTLAKFVFSLVVGFALIASPIVVLLAVGGFLFIGATSGSDPDEKDLPAFAFYLVIALASGLTALWSAVLPGRGRLWRIGLTLIMMLVAAFSSAAMVSIRSDPDARLGSAVEPVAASRAA